MSIFVCLWLLRVDFLEVGRVVVGMASVLGGRRVTCQPLFVLGSYRDWFVQYKE